MRQALRTLHPATETDGVWRRLSQTQTTSITADTAVFASASPVALSHANGKDIADACECLTIQIVAMMLDGGEELGGEWSMQATSTDRVSSFKQKLAKRMAGKGEGCDVRLCFASEVLQDSKRLCDYPGLVLAGGSDGHGAEVTIIKLPTLPQWAKDIGFERTHCTWLQTHYDRYELGQPDWILDFYRIWLRLLEDHESKESQRVEATSWTPLLWMEVNGERVGQVRAKACSTLKVQLRGWVYNKGRYTCKQQVGLAYGPLAGMAEPFAVEVYNGELSRPTQISKSVEVTVPAEAGAHVLYHFMDSKDSWQDAVMHFKLGETKIRTKYPGSFVGWLVVGDEDGDAEHM